MKNFDYVLKRTNRRSVSISIREYNSVVVTAPKRLSQDKIDAFINEKRAWIEKHLASNQAKTNALASVIAHQSVLVEGREVSLKVCGLNSFSYDLVCVTNLKNLKRLYVGSVGKKFIDLYEKICAYTGLKGSSVGFKDYKSRWGCCSKSKEIIFNYKLMMLPVRLWEYVILHELCHTVHMNHSPDFYA
ncbi:MAG: M48 family metallopeptidase, partial [Clostridia bacterium]|nr:M48 family metallopeptidase [Clostridia bacterium]